MRNRQAERPIFELSKHGCSSVRFPATDVPCVPLEELVPSEQLAQHLPDLPEVSEPDLMRHFLNLSRLNMSVDTHFYPLGSCTMKYNPKVNERHAANPKFSQLHPYQPAETVQGLLQLLFELQEMLAEIAGMDAVSLQPAAGAHGELTALLIAAAYFRHLGQKRHVVLVPDSAHGTNPASAAMAGFRIEQVPSTSEGIINCQALKEKLSEDVAVLMVTNPNTLGLFEREITTICRMVHDVGGLIYLDGANMNAILGIARPGDFGADMMHFNPHKTFSTPHGGGGPGAGPIAVKSHLERFLPVPVVAYKNGKYVLDYNRPQSIGKVRSFLGNVGVLIRAYCYLRSMGAEGLRRVAEQAVLNANYLAALIGQTLEIPYGRRCMHEFVASARALKKERGISAMDIAKRLLDFGFHAPTVYFPLIVPEALMIEPTETENKETLDAFAQAIKNIVSEPAELLHEAPHTTPVSRPNEVQAARKPVLRWTPTGS